MKGMKKITVDNLIHHLEVFLRENPSWAEAEVMVVVNHLIVRKGSDIRKVDLQEDSQDLE